jgi:putative ubiquitin-RnfH superfamily antitoxin RatB of RatAB toxin-antitoxin module
MISASKPIAMSELIQVQIIYALPDQFWLQTLYVPNASRIGQVLAKMDSTQFPSDMDIDMERLAIFGRKAKLHDTLHAFDRIEILRPLLFDPKDNRRQRAAMNPLKKPKRR